MKKLSTLLIITMLTAFVGCNIDTKPAPKSYKAVLHDYVYNDVSLNIEAWLPTPRWFGQCTIIHKPQMTDKVGNLYYKVTRWATFHITDSWGRVAVDRKVQAIMKYNPTTKFYRVVEVEYLLK